MSVYNLTGKWLSLYEHEDEIDPEVFKDTSDSIKLELNEDFESCGYVIDNINSDIDGLSKAIKELRERKKAITRNRDKLKETVATSMRATGQKTVKTLSYTFTAPDRDKIILKYQKETLPTSYFNLKPQPDDTRIKADVLAGKEVGDATVTKVPSLTIRH